MQTIQIKPAEEYYRDYIVLLDRYYPEGERDDDELAALKAGVAEVGQTPWFMVNLGDWYYEHGQCDDAETHYEVAMALAPDIESIKEDYEIVRARCVDAQ